MRPLLVIAYVQHGQRPQGYDPGAWADIDGDGLLETWEQESRLAAAYASLIAGKANAQGAQGRPVAGLCVGWGDDIDALPYDEGHRRINALVADWLARNPGGLSAVLACHCNAGGGSYGLVAWDARSGLGRAAADNVAQAWEALLPELDRAKRTPASADGEPYQRRLHYCLRGAYGGPAAHCGLTLEPGFLDSERHRPLWTGGGLDRIATATVAGLMAWAEAA